MRGLVLIIFPVLLSLGNRSICCHILSQVSDRIALDANARSIPRSARRSGRIDPCCVVHKIGSKSRVVLELLIGEIPSQLMDNGGNHLHVAQFFRTYRRVKMEPQMETT